MTSPTPKPVGSAVAEGAHGIQWPDRSHRTVAEAWQLTPAEIVAEQKQYEEPQQRDWRRA